MLRKLLKKKDLSQEEIFSFFSQLEQGHLNEVQIASFFIALKMKGVCAEEIGSAFSYFPKALQASACLDITGTGGAEGKPYNISTAAAFLLALCGVKVAKLFMPALFSSCGSQEILQALAVPSLFDLVEQKKNLREKGIGFFFLSHPIFSHFSPIRKSIRVPTLLDLVAPLLHPVCVEKQIIGVAEEKERKALAICLKNLSFPREVALVGSEEGIDEISPYAPTQVIYVKQGSLKQETLFPEDFGLCSKRKPFFYKNALTSSENIKAIFESKEGKAKEWILVNASFALHFLGEVSSFLEGMERVKEALASFKGKSFFSGKKSFV